MYYKNIQSFYIMQYGPKVLLITIMAVTVLFGGSYFLKQNDITAASLMKAVSTMGSNIKEDKVVEQNASKADDNTPVKEASVSNFQKSFLKEPKKLEFIDKTLNALSANEISKELNVIKVNDINNLIIKDSDGTNYTICMIGVKPTASLDITKEQANYYKQELKNLLENKQVQVQFDSLKTQNNLRFAYIYYNGELLNSKILESGYSKQKIEQNNIANKEKLQKAETKAKEENLEVWQ